jgi:hypothetical protein
MANTGSQAGTKAAKTEMGELEGMLSESPTSEKVCMKLARILSVHRSEVALFRVEKGSLRFIFPVELRSAGVLPLSGTAVAARTAATRTPRLSTGEEDRNMDQMPIQKIMSVPIALADGNVNGVVQVSRKGLDAKAAGADFSGEDLKKLEKAAEILARMPFMQEGAEL